MAQWQMTRRAVSAAALAGPMGAALVCLGLPLTLVIQAAFSASSPSGFERGFGDLAALGAKSLVVAIASALLATGVCSAASFLTACSPRFGVFYRSFLMVMMFTNPLFLVFGLAVLLVDVVPLLAVILASAYILLPLCGLVVQAAVDQIPRQQLLAARALGEWPLGLALRLMLPASLPRLLTASLLGAVYALGFYLTPAYVGIGRISVLGTTIDRTANQTGDWVGAAQLCVVTLLVQAIALLLWAPVRLAAQRCQRG